MRRRGKLWSALLQRSADAAAVFDDLLVLDDAEPRSASANMAIDEALLAVASRPTLRFYRWRSPALSFGYFGAFAAVADDGSSRELVRRWTGGGIVLHGSDLTYSVILPAHHVTAKPSRAVYAFVHEAIRRALGSEAALATNSSARVSDACFANPVQSDVMVGEQKVAGAAQRRTRAGLLHQGSIQLVEFPADFKTRFVAELAARSVYEDVPDAILATATHLETTRYGTRAWLELR